MCFNVINADFLMISKAIDVIINDGRCNEGDGVEKEKELYLTPP